MKTVVVIPAYNEAKRITDVVANVQRFVKDVIVVDDGSRDGTFAAARRLDGVIVLRHRVNLGKGAALKTGSEYARRIGADTLVYLDADGQHRPEELPSLLVPIETKGVDIVFGVRSIVEQTSMPFVARLGNLFLSAATRTLFHISVADTQCGYRALAMRAYDRIRWESSNYTVETEMIVRAGRNGLRTAEVPISTVYNDQYKGTTVFDGLRIFYHMLLWRIHP